ncbi:hypothetical protein GCM10007424_12850 [Flavobacterium suaedae]|uniref:Putative beta-lactamase-inhibitor-like PepSY-like domain-containing protein n=1 Tax=Flavobacterium suaedae TaxID=1767027 RepID=A0ABQ1JSB2_9FLAO|nr:PepSY-like domain-containing protein [Flavobacterium suaedae]GGB74367.1 hypothetical protein GCM10007424_12850 [Flavobacterium suaedae]
MKKNILLILSLLFAVTLYAQEVPITYKELPQQAQKFIVKNFTDDFSFAIKEVYRGKVIYTATLEDDTKITFDEVGDWETVTGKNKKIPYSFIQMPIKEYVKINYPEKYIVKIKRTDLNYIITLNNNIDLTFDAQGIYTRTD